MARPRAECQPFGISPKHCKDNQRLFRPELSLGLLRDNIECNAYIRPRTQPKDTVANPDWLATVS